MDEDTKFKVLGKLGAGDECREIAKDLGLSYSSVLKIRKDFREAKRSSDMRTVLDADEIIINRVVSEVKQELAIIHPESSEEMNKSITEFVDGLTNATLLETQLQVTAMDVNLKIKHLLRRDDVGASTVVALTKALTSIYSAFFAKGSVVNINNQTMINNGESMHKFKDINQTD